MVVCVIMYLYYAHAHEPLKLKALQAQRRLSRVRGVTRRINATSLRLARKINPVLKVTRVKEFGSEELAEATGNFSEENRIGRGGYGTVYKGELQDGKQVAVKLLQQGSVQGDREFYNEIELLSRVHHRNIVMLEGYCDEDGHQMLVYELIPGGTLRDRLFGVSLDWATRLKIALGTARGIMYLHTEADPPIFHRDIKASNILLDSRKGPKVADFGLSCLAPVADMEGVTADHISTVVKGTPGYLDPEYYMTQQLTEKSDVYSFGVVMLELITGTRAITQGKNIVQEAYKRAEEGNLLSMVDPEIAQHATEQLEWVMELALSCCAETLEQRPTMSEVVSDLEQLGRSHGGAFSVDISRPGTPNVTPKLRHVSSPNKPSSVSSGGGTWSDSTPYLSPR